MRRLKAAGAVVAGKTVTTEFAGPDPGATANPWDTGRTPGGSSSGSAAGVASGEFHIGIGTQTRGSVGRPGAFCGVVAYKPTYGRTPTEGVAIYAPSVDTVGFFTPDVDGMCMVAAASVDGWDEGATEAACMVGASSLVLGVPEGPYLRSFSLRSLSAFDQALADLEDVGVTIRRVPGVLEDWDEVAQRHTDLTGAEWAQTLAGVWATHAAAFGAQSAVAMDEGLAVSAGAERTGREGRARLRVELEGLMDKAGVDLLVTPGTTQGPAPKGLHLTGDPGAQMPWSHSGLPTLSLPSGLVHGRLPVALQLVARPHRDEALLGYGTALGRVGLSRRSRRA